MTIIKDRALSGLPYSLFAAVVLLAIGPIAGRFMTNRRICAFVDGLVLITVLGLVLLVLVPEALALAGWWSVLVVIGAFGLPWVAERYFHHIERQAHKALLLIAVVALALHGAGDGAVLSLAEHKDGSGGLVAGLLLHRAGAGLALWWLMRPILGAAVSFFILALMAAVTIGGFYAAELNGDMLHGTFAGLWQALAAGSLLHVVLHPLGHAMLDQRDARMAHRSGTSAGIAMLMVFVFAHTQLGQVIETGAGHGHDMGHQSIDLLILSAAQLAPLLLFIFGLFLLRGIVKHRAFRPAMRQGARASLAVWLVAGFAVGLQTDMEQVFAYLSSLPGAQVSLIVWAVAVIGVCITEGARSLLGGMLPTHSHHQHDSHNHSH